MTITMLEKHTAGAARATIHHDEIRSWVERRGGRPAAVLDRFSHAPGGIAIDLGSRHERPASHISWQEFFDRFEQQDLAFEYQEETDEGAESTFFRLIRR